MSELLFRISVIDGLINISSHLAEYPGSSITDTVRRLRAGPVISAAYYYEGALELGELLGWDHVAIEGNRQEQLRGILKQMAIRIQPFWARMSRFGIQRVLKMACSPMPISS